MTSLSVDPSAADLRAAAAPGLTASGLAGVVVRAAVPAAGVTLVCFIPSGLVACAHAIAALGHALGGRSEASRESTRAAGRWCVITAALGLLRDAPLLAAWAGSTLV